MFADTARVTNVRIIIRSPPKFNHVFNGPLLTFPENFIQIHLEVFAQSC